MGIPLKVLIVEDSKADAELLLIELERGGYDPTYERVDTARAMDDALENGNWDIILADYVMPSFSGLAALMLLQSKGIDVPFIVVSGQIGEDIAVETMKAGASDYILKGHLARLVPAVERELRETVVRRERRQAQEERDRLMEQLREVNAQLAASSVRALEQVEDCQRLGAELTAVFTAIAEPLIIYGPAGEIQRLNPAAEDLLGYGEGERDKPLLDRLALMRPETTDGHPFPVERTPVAQVKHGEIVRCVVMVLHRRSDGKPMRVSLSAAPVKAADGTNHGAVAVFTDITDLSGKL